MSKKILTIVGARPQFIKASVLSKLIKEKYNVDFQETLIHTGQHFDNNMSKIFFDEMELPKPDYNLGISTSSHGSMTGLMLIELEKLILLIKPDLILVYGDTNSTLAGALAGSKLNIPIAHVEAGLRSYWKQMPEEQNRILTDHLSSFLFCPTETAVNNLAKEGITAKVYNVGDIMLDSFNFYLQKVNFKTVNLRTVKGEEHKIEAGDLYHLFTLHRAENTADSSTVTRIFQNLGRLEEQIIFPVHPRTAKLIASSNIRIPENLVLVEPVGYFTMLFLLKNCQYVITDSGGLQKEAFFMKKRCFTLRNQTEWVETLEKNWNSLLNVRDEFYQKINYPEALGSYNLLFGEGDTGERILNILRDKLV